MCIKILLIIILSSCSSNRDIDREFILREMEKTKELSQRSSELTGKINYHNEEIGIICRNIENLKQNTEKIKEKEKECNTQYSNIKIQIDKKNRQNSSLRRDNERKKREIRKLERENKTDYDKKLKSIQKNMEYAEKEKQAKSRN